MTALPQVVAGAAAAFSAWALLTIVDRIAWAVIS